MIHCKEVNWHSQHLDRNMNIRIYGSADGTPILVFPTQDAMSDNFENFGMIDALANDLGRVQLFCVDTVDTETWSNTWGDKSWRAWRQEAYYTYIISEVLPFISMENSSGRMPLAAGCSLGAMHAAIVFFRRPDLFGGVLALSGVYDAKFFTDGWTVCSMKTPPLTFSAICPQIIHISSSTISGGLSCASGRAHGRTKGAAQLHSWGMCSTTRAFMPGWTSGATTLTMTGHGGKISFPTSSRSCSASKYNEYIEVRS